MIITMVQWNFMVSINTKDVINYFFKFIFNVLLAFYKHFIITVIYLTVVKVFFVVS